MLTVYQTLFQRLSCVNPFPSHHPTLGGWYLVMQRPRPREVEGLPRVTQHQGGRANFESRASGLSLCHQLSRSFSALTGGRGGWALRSALSSPLLGEPERGQWLTISLTQQWNFDPLVKSRLTRGAGLPWRFLGESNPEPCQPALHPPPSPPFCGFYSFLPDWIVFPSD